MLIIYGRKSTSFFVGERGKVTLIKFFHHFHFFVEVLHLIVVFRENIQQLTYPFPRVCVLTPIQEV